jgi:hypothetical protein
MHVYEARLNEYVNGDTEKRQLSYLFHFFLTTSQLTPTYNKNNPPTHPHPHQKKKKENKKRKQNPNNAHIVVSCVKINSQNNTQRLFAY